MENRAKVRMAGNGELKGKVNSRRENTMKLCAVLAIVVGVLVVAPESYAVEPSGDVPAQIKALQKERVEVLQSLVDVHLHQYMAGVIYFLAVVGAETDLVNAQLDAADKSEERVALLTAALTRERQVLRIVEQRFQAATATQADVDWARSICLYTEVRLAIMENKGLDRIKGLRMARAEALSELVDILAAQFRQGTSDCEPLVWAEAALVNAHTDTTDSTQERIALLTKDLERQAAHLKMMMGAKVSLPLGDVPFLDTVSKADLYRLQALVLATRMKLLRERSRVEDVATQLKTAQKEWVGMIGKILDVYRTQHEAARIGIERVLDAQTELLNAKLDVTDGHKERLTLLTELVKVATDRVAAVEARYKAGIATQAVLLQAHSLLLDAKIRLLRERIAPKANSPSPSPHQSSVLPQGWLRKGRCRRVRCSSVG